MALTLEELRDRLGLGSVRQVRRRVDLARSLLAPHIQHGKNNQLFFDSNAVALLDRLRQRENQGRTIEQAIEDIRTEIEATAPDKQGQSDGNRAGKSETGAEVLQVKVEFLEKQVDELTRRGKDLTEERNRLLAIIEDKDEQIKVLMPGRDPDRLQRRQSGGGMSRWEHLKAALLGRS